MRIWLRRRAVLGRAKAAPGCRPVKPNPRFIRAEEMHLCLGSNSGVVSESNGNYELNFSDAELSELAKVVFKDTLNTPYVFDERVQEGLPCRPAGPFRVTSS